MNRRHWVWLAIGLVAWGTLVVLWATGPRACTPPDDNGHVTCQH